MTAEDRLTDDCQREKADIRREMKDWLRARPPEETRAESERICAWLRPHLGEGTVAAFFPLPGEVDLRELLAELAPAGRLVLPRVASGALTLHRVRDLGRLVPGPLGLREPRADAALVSPSEVHVFLVPGLAFTPDGARLGRGKGLYDRLLVNLSPHRTTIGIGFAHQVVARLPTEPHDIPLSCVVPAQDRAC